MRTRRISSLVRIGAVLSAAIALGACTPGGQFDPTDILSSDIFNSKKRLQGDREPLFPNGVPGAETGVPPDLMKGYQAPPEQADASAEAPPAASKPAAEVKPKPKPKPKPVVAHAPPPPGVAPRSQDPAWNRAPAPMAGQQPWPAPQPGQPAQSAWPAAPQAQGQQAAQPPQPAWPNPPAAGTYSR